ncbi:carboxymethylenebutenolidase [Sphingobium sp. JAI105]|uniref:dienelactone hydrolase family protein n=1 Tax=Sphingobium sp. JAI105 TaxID=2787715 RepID=UPI0018CA7F97|nr:dienelactone hydrolase family protein [Sphingobium sp. JAI105]MBG6118483.1 carboxymethylenebutenolidase [Sphingobium sp. JAI105]
MSNGHSQGDGKTPPGLLLTAGGDAPRPGIVLLQEIFGLNSSMRIIAENFTSLGYDVFAIDLFWRQQADVQLDPTDAGDRERAQALMAGLSEKEALADISGAARSLRRRSTATGKVAAVGYCLGGRLAYLAAADDLIDATVSYYGVAIHRSLDLADKISVPVLLHIAGEDHLCDEQAQKDLYAAFEHRHNFLLHTYQSAGHGFARPNSPLWKEGAANLANGVTSQFLADVLKDGDDR